MGTVIIEQFNPISKHWNKLYEVDQNDFDPDAPYKMNKYDGPYRTRVVGEEIIDEILDIPNPVSDWVVSDVSFDLNKEEEIEEDLSDDNGW